MPSTNHGRIALILSACLLCLALMGAGWDTPDSEKPPQPSPYAKEKAVTSIGDEPTPQAKPSVAGYIPYTYVVTEKARGAELSRNTYLVTLTPANPAAVNREDLLKIARRVAADYTCREHVFRFLIAGDSTGKLLEVVELTAGDASFAKAALTDEASGVKSMEEAEIPLAGTGQKQEPATATALAPVGSKTAIRHYTYTVTRKIRTEEISRNVYSVLVDPSGKPITEADVISIARRIAPDYKAYLDSFYFYVMGGGTEPFAILELREGEEPMVDSFRTP